MVEVEPVIVAVSSILVVTMVEITKEEVMSLFEEASEEIKLLAVFFENLPDRFDFSCCRCSSI